MKAIYTNSEDYGRGSTVTKRVKVVGYVHGASENMARYSGQHPAQTLAICVTRDGEFITARLHQLKVPIYRFPWWKVRDRWKRFKRWLKAQTPQQREFVRGRKCIFDQFETDDYGVVYPSRDTVVELVERVRGVNSYHFIRGAESVLNDWHYTRGPGRG